MRRGWVAWELTLCVAGLLACQRTDAPLPVNVPEAPQAELPVPEPVAEEPFVSVPGMPSPQVPQPAVAPRSPSLETTPAPPPPSPPDAPEPEARPEPANSALGLDALEARLRQTDALGFFTKLSLKNEIDDLLDDVRAYYVKQQGTLEALGERFDLLMMKVLTLLQDDDPALAEEVSRSREALWALLSDPEGVALQLKETR